MPRIKEPTDEQRDIIAEKGNVVVTARPGSGKTFTIVEKIYQISQDLYDYQGVIAISFTKKASRELEMRSKNRGVQRKRTNRERGGKTIGSAPQEQRSECAGF